jgi:hypothetical protein
LEQVIKYTDPEKDTHQHCSWLCVFLGRDHSTIIIEKDASTNHQN